jgi:hypothetical protein
MQPKDIIFNKCLLTTASKPGHPARVLRHGQISCSLKSAVRA